MSKKNLYYILLHAYLEQLEYDLEYETDLDRDLLDLESELDDDLDLDLERKREDQLLLELTELLRWLILL